VIDPASSGHCSVVARTRDDKLRLLERARELGNVSRACEELGFSRDSYYRLKRRYERAGADGLSSSRRHVPLLKNRVGEEVESALLEATRRNPDLGQATLARLLQHQGVRISPGGVRSVWLRHGLQRSEHRKVYSITTFPPS
jgi:transposase